MVPLYTNAILYFIRLITQITQPHTTISTGHIQRKNILIHANPPGVRYVSLSLAAGRLTSIGYSS